MSDKFDASKLPREQLLEEAFPGQEIRPDKGGWARVRCTLPNCEHANGDKNPSLSINVESGSFECRKSGTQGKVWKDLVTLFWGDDRWRELCREAFPRDPNAPRKPATFDTHWRRLSTEAEITQGLGIDPELARLYLRRGVRYTGDPESQTVFALRRFDPVKGPQLVGIKWRRTPGTEWQKGAMQNDPSAKFAFTKGSDPSVVFLAELLHWHQTATVVVCAGEKDALALASHLPRDRWAPCSGCYGEGRLPEELCELVEGRRVVIAYDGDKAGQEGAWKAWDLLKSSAFSVQVAKFPEDTPPGGSKPGWDVSDVILHQGPEGLTSILEAAGEVPAEWKPKGAKPTPPPHSGKPSKVVSALASWNEFEGQVVKWVRKRGKKDPETKEQTWDDIPHCMFRGLPRIKQVRRVWTEDPDQPSGWLESESVTYAFKLTSGRMIERRTTEGLQPFLRLLDSTDLAGSAEAVNREDRSKLHLHTVQKSRDHDRVVERCAVGPHGEHGWLAPPGVRVFRGRVERTPYRVGSPEDSEEFRRYRLDLISNRDFGRVSQWIVSDLMKCDHAGGNYVLPLMASILAAPLWEYVRELASWQRYVAFVQGSSGIGKSQFTRYLMSFWGNFIAPQGLTNFASSATYIEALLHHAKGVPLFVADFKEGNMEKAAYKAMMKQIQSYADRSSRGRAQRGGSELERKRPPRCAWIMDGEDLPKGEQSTLGRLVILEMLAHGETKRCASADAEHLDLNMMSKLPGVTARWIAWVQVNAEALGEDLRNTVADLDQVLGRGSTNRSRISRNYAVQLVSIRSFLSFLEGAGKAGPAEEIQRLKDQAWTVHVNMANSQMKTVADEGAGEQFLTQLVGLLKAGRAWLRPEEPRQDMNEPMSGPHPYGHPPNNAECIGTYHEGNAYIWPVQALAVVNQQRIRGGGQAIPFSVKSILQILEESRVVVDRERRRVSEPGEERSSRRVRTWTIPLEEIEGKVRTDLYSGAR